MCTLFDNDIMFMFKAEFNTSDMQFGFMEDHSTTSCTCLLDASKSYDHVHYGKLFNILLSKDILKCVVLLIFGSYLSKRHV